MYSDQNKSRGIEIDLCDTISPTSQIVTQVCGEFLMTVQLHQSQIQIIQVYRTGKLKSLSFIFLFKISRCKTRKNDFSRNGHVVSTMRIPVFPWHMWPLWVKPLTRSTPRHQFLVQMPKAKVSWLLCIGRLVSKTDNVIHFAHLVKQACVDLVSDLFVYYRLGCEPFVCSWGLHIQSCQLWR